MRRANQKEQFTPFGLWLQEYVRQDISITNLDYVLEDYKTKKIMLLEEKQHGGKLHRAQTLTFEVMDWCLYKAAEKRDYDYWGFFLFQMPEGASMPGPGMMMNGKIITGEQLQQHLEFKIKFCAPFEFEWRKRVKP
jgi:hypothetical protein